MATLVELARSHTRLTADDAAHLQRLAAAWGMLADLCFADLLLLAPVAGEEGHRFVVLAQVRPTTEQTLYRDDMVGTIVDEVERPVVARVWRIGEIGVGDAAVIGQTGERANVQAIPVRHRGKVIALLTREAATTTGRRLGELERVYFEIFDRFARMLYEGTFPFKGGALVPEEAPRVGDGVLFLDTETTVRYASPNAVSSLHRMGIHANAQGQRLSDTGLDDDAVRTAFAARAVALGGRNPRAFGRDPPPVGGGGGGGPRPARPPHPVQGRGRPRRPPGRGGHPAGRGADRAAPERRGARLPRQRVGGDAGGLGHRAAGAGRRRGRGRRRRRRCRPAARLLPRDRLRARAVDRADAGAERAGRRADDEERWRHPGAPAGADRRSPRGAL